MLNTNRKIALVTGSGRGMGRAIALKLAQEHIPVVINDLDRDLAEETQELIFSLDRKRWNMPLTSYPRHGKGKIQKTARKQIDRQFKAMIKS